jgi:hypothetical protein
MATDQISQIISQIRDLPAAAARARLLEDATISAAKRFAPSAPTL